VKSTPGGEHDDFVALTRLAEVWDGLERLVRKCSAREAVTLGDEKEFATLMKEAQVLVGRLSHCMHRPMVELWGRSWDAITTLLGATSISSLISEHTVGLWFISLSGARSETRQAIGRVEAERQKIGLSPETIVRWRWLIAILERLRTWATSRPSFIDRQLDKIEGSRAYRAASIMSTFGGFIGVVILLLGVTAFVIRVVL